MLSPGTLPGILTDMPVSALVQQAELNQQDPSLMSLSSRPDVLGREAQVTRVTVPKLTLRPQSRNYLIPAVCDRGCPSLHVLRNLPQGLAQETAGDMVRSQS